MHYEVSGDASRPTLILSHSLGVSLAMWEPQVAWLGSHFRLLRYDTRGHGQSAIPAGPYSVGDLGGDVLGLMDALEIESASFCGVSMGGVIGQWLGIHAPNRIEKLVLANTAAKIGTAETWDARIETVKDQGLEPIIGGTLDRWFTPAFRSEHPGTVDATRSLLQATLPEGYIACCAAIRDADFRGDLGSIAAPTLIVSGSHDPVTPPGDGRYLAREIAGAEYVELPAAHLSNLEAAAEFNEALFKFLMA
jgi:3-oxoadipate enol-lactonase